jgi:hypothetical protein
MGVRKLIQPLSKAYRSAHHPDRTRSLAGTDRIRNSKKEFERVGTPFAFTPEEHSGAEESKMGLLIQRLRNVVRKAGVFAAYRSL